MAMRFAAIAIASVLATAGTYIVMGPLQGYAETSGSGALKAISDFDAITDTSARSKAIFEEASRVLTHPRCINCHPATRSPTQGEDKHPHVPLDDRQQQLNGSAGSCMQHLPWRRKSSDRRKPHEIHPG